MTLYMKVESSVVLIDYLIILGFVRILAHISTLQVEELIPSLSTCSFYLFMFFNMPLLAPSVFNVT
jgi:hypothetical protein